MSRLLRLSQIIWTSLARPGNLYCKYFSYSCLASTELPLYLKLVFVLICMPNIKGALEKTQLNKSSGSKLGLKHKVEPYGTKFRWVHTEPHSQYMWDHTVLLSCKVLDKNLHKSVVTMSYLQTSSEGTSVIWLRPIRCLTIMSSFRKRNNEFGILIKVGQVNI